MTKQLSIKIEKCEDCYYFHEDRKGSYMGCNFMDMVLRNKNIIHKECKLPDAEEESKMQTMAVLPLSGLDRSEWIIVHDGKVVARGFGFEPQSSEVTND